MMLVLSGLGAAVAVFSQNSLSTGRTQLLDKQAFYLAEAAWQRARQALVAGDMVASASPGTTYGPHDLGAGQFRVTIVDNGSSVYTITAEGYAPTYANYHVRRQLTEQNISVTVSNGTNRSLTATATASSSNGSHTPDKAKDGSAGTKWQSNTNGDGSWLKMDYGGSPPTLDKIVIEEDANINGVTIEWSADNSTWTTPSGLSVIESPSKTWTATFTEGARRYVRATFTASGSSKKAAVEEMESYNSSLTALGAGDVTTQW
jgi:hypothetical protein